MDLECNPLIPFSSLALNRIVSMYLSGRREKDTVSVPKALLRT